MEIGRRKTFVVGFRTTAQSALDLSEELLNEGYVNVKTRLLQQDYLEQFFGLLHQRGGWNDNPSALDVNYALRRIIAVKHCSMFSSINRNCSLPKAGRDKEEVEDSETVEDRKTNDSETESETETGFGHEFEAANPNNMPSVNVDKLIISSQQTQENDIYKKVVKNMLVYLAGYTVHQMLGISTKIHCPQCRIALVLNDNDLVDEECLAFLELKNTGGDYGGLTKPSKSVYLIVDSAQKVFQTEVLDCVAMNNVLPTDQIICEMLTKKAIVQLHNTISISALFPAVHDSNYSVNNGRFISTKYH